MVRRPGQVALIISTVHPIAPFPEASPGTPYRPIGANICVIFKYTDRALAKVGRLNDIKDLGDVRLVIKCSIVTSFHRDILSCVEDRHSRQVPLVVITFTIYLFLSVYLPYYK